MKAVFADTSFYLAAMNSGDVKHANAVQVGNRIERRVLLSDFIRLPHYRCKTQSETTLPRRLRASSAQGLSGAWATNARQCSSARSRSCISSSVRAR